MAGSGTQQVEDVHGVASIRLRFGHDHGPDLRGIADEHGVTQALHQCVEPEGVPGAFDADGDGAGQGRIECLNGGAVVREPTLEDFTGLGIEHSDVLAPRVKITANESHESGLRFEGW